MREKQQLLADHEMKANLVFQPFLFAEHPDCPWVEVKDGTPGLRPMLNRHYSARRSSSGAALIVGPGEKMVLVTADKLGLFVWRKFISMDSQHGVNCSVFRNEGNLLSSDLIRSAVTRAWRRWPRERLYTYANAKKIRSTNPGACFKFAGWRKCGETKRGLIILEMMPPLYS